jgi:hypothetical protein
MKQCATCAGCPMNEFGSAQQGNGKACREHQKIAVATNTGVYEFSLPATSWKNYRAYVKEAARHQINNLALVSTVLGFDSNFDYTVFSFGFGGYLDENQARKIAEMKNGEVYEAIVGSAPKEVIPAIPEAPAAPVLKVVKPAVEEAVYAPVEETVYAPVEEEPIKPKAGRPAKVKEVEPVKASDLSSLAASLGLEL